MAAHLLYVHLAWTTRERRPMINAATQTFLDGYLRRTAAQERTDVIALAILSTHVHMIIRTPPRIDLPRLVQLCKGGSSYAGSRLPGNVIGLRWAPEYSATSVSPKQLPVAIRYLERQAAHHPGEAIPPQAESLGSASTVLKHRTHCPSGQ
jgi:putative transposase